MNSKIVIGTRGSKLALWQTNWVRGELLRLHPEIEIETRTISTKGDRVLNVSLPKLGEQGKGLFTKELEDAIFEGTIDLAVHSLKDLPTELPAGLQIGAICEREDVRDALVTRDGAGSLATLRRNAVVGTSSLRRQAQLKIARPDLKVVPVRGNVDTRLRKLDEGEYDAIVLAAAGLHRLGYRNRITEHLSNDVVLSAVGQGALAIETRTNDDRIDSHVRALDHWATRIACRAERAFLKGLGGGCLVPIAAHATTSGNDLKLIGLVADPGGERVVRGESVGSAQEPEQVGMQLADDLLSRGADKILGLP